MWTIFPKNLTLFQAHLHSLRNVFYVDKPLALVLQHSIFLVSQFSTGVQTKLYFSLLSKSRSTEMAKSFSIQIVLNLANACYVPHSTRATKLVEKCQRCVSSRNKRSNLWIFFLLIIKDFYTVSRAPLFPLYEQWSAHFIFCSFSPVNHN